MRRLLTWGAIALALGATACASASKDAAAPESPAGSPAAGEAEATAAASPPMAAPRPAPQDPSPAEDGEPGAALARAEAELDDALGGGLEFAKPPVGAETSPAKKEGDAPRRERLHAEHDSCTTACRALASMRRSAERICDLAGGGAAPDRCDDARSRVTKAESRVRERCASCSADR